MKFPKGLLTDATDPTETDAERAGTLVPSPPAPVAGQRTAQPADAGGENDRLFETVDRSQRTGRRYLALLFVVCVSVGAIGSAAWYVMRPGIGDRTTAPAGLEQAVRDHLLEKEKRTATDIEFYLCDGFYWTRVGVETRTDMPNPIWRVGTYAARAVPADSSWLISAVPAPSPETLVACS